MNDYMAYKDYMDLAVHCPRKAIKLKHSLTAHNPVHVYKNAWYV